MLSALAEFELNRILSEHDALKLAEVLVRIAHNLVQHQLPVTAGRLRHAVAEREMVEITDDEKSNSK